VNGPSRPSLLITGASGLLGWSLCREFAADFDVLAPGLEEFDILHRENTIAYIRAACHRLVIHAAAYTAVDTAEAEPGVALALNRDGTEAVAEGARQAGSRLAYISSDYVFDGRKGTPYGEDDEAHPLGSYARSKLEGEVAARGVVGDCLVVRTAWIFGPGRPNFVSGMARRALAGEEVRVVDDQTGSPTYTPHLARAIGQLCRRRFGGLFHTVNRGTATWHGLTREIYRLLGADPGLVRTISTGELGRPAPRPAYSALDSSRLEQVAGIRLPPWQEALAEYLGDRGNWEPTGN
jgi:dTDP-4-dehydrorhamnose reductase